MAELRHIIESQQFDRPWITRLFEQTEKLQRSGKTDTLRDMTMASLFYEPSTRTRFSFEAAMYRLGGNVITTENAQHFSSQAKGESLEDTLAVLAGYVDLIVMRHNEIGAAQRAAHCSEVPLINAGDGAGQHPTQALLDLFTLHRAFEQIDGLRVALVGDLRFGRTVRSLSYLLSKYEGITLHFVAPPVSRMSEDITDYLSRHGVCWEALETLEDILPHVDCVYMTRIQKERFAAVGGFEQARDLYRLNAANMRQLPQKSIVMHPLPRVQEIATEVDADPRAMYFEQARNGLWVRMALLLYVLGHWD